MVTIILTKETCLSCKRLEESIEEDECTKFVDVDTEEGKFLVRLLNIKTVPSFITICEQKEMVEKSE